jgi:hypothetical protein
MSLVLSYDDMVLRVDGDVFEIFFRGAFSHRIPLAWLVVQVQPSIKGRLVLRMTCAREDLPLYEVMQKARILPGSSTERVIRTEEEPIYREFFIQVAQLCNRPVVLP